MHNKRVVISTNNNPDYFFYVPITSWAWHQLGWDVAVLITHDVNPADIKLADETKTEVHQIPEVKGVRTSTLAQVGRHFCSNILNKDEYLLLSDIDMIPLSNYIQPDVNKKTVWGWDLTGRGFIPVSYIGMKGSDWYELMECTGNMAENMEVEMMKNGRAYAEKWEDYWDADWDILTKKVIPRKNEFTFIDRGFVNIYKHQTAKGRVERWYIRELMNQPELIDCHAENHNPSAPEKWSAVKDAMIRGFGSVPEWMDKYVIEHHKKYGQ